MILTTLRMECCIGPSRKAGRSTTGRSRPRPSDYWLGLAAEDLAGARSLFTAEQLEPRHSVGLAAQAAEKALKAALAQQAIEPPRTHDLVALAHRAGGILRVTVSEHDLRRLSDAHEHARYPDPDEPIYDRGEAAELLAIATAVVDCVTAVLKGE